MKKSILIKLRIYDTTGRAVANLISERKAAGDYSVNFDASNLASGVYIYRLIAKNFTQAKKMTLIK